MHCELVVPALFAAQEIPRLPALELLLARGRAAHADPLSLEAWLAQIGWMSTIGKEGGLFMMIGEREAPGSS